MVHVVFVHKKQAQMKMVPNGQVANGIRIKTRDRNRLRLGGRFISPRHMCSYHKARQRATTATLGHRLHSIQSNPGQSSPLGYSRLSARVSQEAAKLLLHCSRRMRIEQRFMFGHKLQYPCHRHKPRPSGIGHRSHFSLQDVAKWSSWSCRQAARTSSTASSFSRSACSNCSDM